MFIGDIVRLEYDSDSSINNKFLYRVKKIQGERVYLTGLYHRASIIKLSKSKSFNAVPKEDVEAFARKVIKTNEEKMKQILIDRDKRLDKNVSYTKPKVLHLDADESYLSICMKFYETMDINAKGYVIDETLQPKKIGELLEKHNPDIVVVTGHDIDNDDNDIEEISDYENSIYYVEATKQARLYEPSKTGLVIIAGACQSSYDAIMEAGANFASSPARKMIDVLDPCYVVESIAYTHFKDTVIPSEAVKYVSEKDKAIGGIETFGVLRIVEPKF